LILRHDVLHTWSDPYIQRAPATLGPCRSKCCRPTCKCQLQRRGGQVVRPPGAA